jgi:hypothetical protein
LRGDAALLLQPLRAALAIDVPWSEDETAKDWYARVRQRSSFRSILAETVSGIRPSRPTQISTSERRGAALKVAVGEQLPSPMCCSGSVVSPDRSTSVLTGRNSTQRPSKTPEPALFCRTGATTGAFNL